MEEDRDADAGEQGASRALQAYRLAHVEEEPEPAHQDKEVEAAWQGHGQPSEGADALEDPRHKVVLDVEPRKWQRKSGG